MMQSSQPIIYGWYVDIFLTFQQLNITTRFQKLFQPRGAAGFPPSNLKEYKTFYVPT